MKFYRAGLTAGVLAAALALAACGSSGGGSKGNSPSDTGSAPGSSSSSSSAAAPTCSAGTLKAEGSSAQSNAMTAWINAYTKACTSAKINYTASGSGAGVSGFNAGQDNFAGSDSALNADAGEVTAAAKRCASPALNLPMVIGPIAVAVNINGVTKLTLTPDLIAKIFTGKITKWNDSAITAKNSGVTLPSSKINVIYRSDASGTTANFEKYLAATDPTDFTAEPAKDNSQKVFTGQGKTGSQGVAAGIKATSDSIGYVEYSFAVSGSLTTAAVDSGQGAVDVSKDSASKAASEATVTAAAGSNDLSLKINYKPTAAGAYPIILATYEIVCTTYADKTIGTLVKNFLTYTADGGQSLLPALGYAPLPSDLQAKVQASVAKIS